MGCGEVYFRDREAPCLPLLRVSAEECEPRSAVDRAGHIGVHPQSQDGLRYIGISIPVGRYRQIKCARWPTLPRNLAAESCGSLFGRISLIPNVPSERVELAVNASALWALNVPLARFCAEPWPVLETVAAVTQPPTPRRTPLNSRAFWMLDSRLISRSTFTSPAVLTPARSIMLETSACLAPRSRARKAIRSLSAADPTRIKALHASSSPPSLTATSSVFESLFAAFEERRNPNESFLQFSRRHSIPELQSFLPVVKEPVSQ